MDEVVVKEMLGSGGGPMKVGARLKLDVGVAATVKSSALRNILPPTDWIANGEKAPTLAVRHFWEDGSKVQGYDLVLQFEDGSRLLAWVAAGDFRLTFYDFAAARERFGVYSTLFAPPSRVSTIAPGVVVFTDEFIQ
jgi:hypothetical protein